MKSKVLFVMHLPPPIHGASMMGDYIKQSLQVREEFEADFINLSSSKSLLEIGKGGLKKNYHVFLIFLKVLKQLLSKKYDLVYMTLTATGPGFYKDALVVAILKIFRRKIIFHFHNKGISRVKETAFNRMVYRFVFSNTRSILISKSLYKDFKKYLALENVFFCPYGIPIVDKLVSNRPLTKEKSEVTSFLFLSNMMKEKGVYDLLDACESLSFKNLSFKCDFVGAWSDISEEDFKKELKMRNLENIAFGFGSKYGEDKNQFFRNADVFVFPTYYHNESFPVVILEAMQFGLPVISTFEGGIADEVTDLETGYLVIQRDTISLAAQMESFIKNPDLAVSMGALGKKRFFDCFTIDIFQDNLIKILKAVINDRLSNSL